MSGICWFFFLAGSFFGGVLIGFLDTCWRCSQ